MFDTPENEDKDAFEFYGRVQAVLQHRHKNCNFVALELKTKDKQAIKDMFKKWTQMSVNMTDGAPLKKIVKMRCYHLWTLVNQLD